jgi:2-polyprenyl-3-methyl-5-hydroxy-6-metoxy-1,4-benzoquinol methylase
MTNWSLPNVRQQQAGERGSNRDTVRYGFNELDPQPNWPESWRISHSFDELELYGSRRNLGYRYAYDVRKRRILSLIHGVAKRGDRIIDVAAAQGNFSIALAQAGYDVTWNDIRSDLIDFVKLKYDGGGITFRPGNLFELDDAVQYDVAVVAEVIEHTAHPDQFLAQAARLTRPGGYIVLTTPNGRYFRNRLPRFSDFEDVSRFEATQFKPDADGHIFLLHPAEIHALADASGLDVVDFALFGNPLTCGYLRTRALLHVLPRAAVDGFEALTARLPGPISDRINTSLTVLMRKR